MRFTKLAFPISFVLGIFVMGCQNAGNPQSASDANSPSSIEEKARTEAKAQSKKAPEVRILVVPEDTVLTAVLDQSISSKTSATGDRFLATIEGPVEVAGKVAIPKGAHAEGRIVDAKAAGRFKGGAALSLTLTTVTVNGKDYEIQTTPAAMSSKGKGKRTAAMVGGGGAGGALIGGLAGGGKGAAIGAIVGAAAGAGGAGFTGNRDITLAAETTLDFKLTQRVSIHEK
jgi:hypothetical protein